MKSENARKIHLIEDIISGVGQMNMYEQAYVSARYKCDSNRDACERAGIDSDWLEKWGDEHTDYLNQVSDDYLIIHQSYLRMRDYVETPIATFQHGRFARFVYVATASTGNVKIGATNNLLTRLKDLSKEYGQPIELLHVIRCVEKNGFHVERQLHRHFIDKQYLKSRNSTRSDWFTLSDDDVQWIKDEYPTGLKHAIKEINTELSKQFGI